MAKVRQIKWSVVLVPLWMGWLVCSPAWAGQAASHSKAQKASAALTVEDVTKLSKAGLSEDIIIQQIRKNGKAFDLSTEQLIVLKEAKVSDRVVEIMLDPSKAESPLAATAAVPETLSAPAAPVAAAVPVGEREPPVGALPTEVGVYVSKQGRWEEVSPEIVYWKTGGALKTVATAGLRHIDVNGHVPGAASRTRLGAPLEFLIVAPEGTAMTEYQLLRLHAHKDNREFRTVTGGFLHAQSGAQRDQVPFDGKKVASRAYEVAFPATAGPGEYGLLPPSSTSGQGKIYSFRVMQ